MLVDYFISQKHATFRIEATNGKITFAAPIASWAKGKDEKYVIDYYKRKGALIEVL